MSEAGDERDPDPLAGIRQFVALEPDVLVLSVAMFGFSLAFQMTGRWIPQYLDALGASAAVVGLYASLGKLLGAVYPYPGGALSDRVGSRLALTGFGVLATLGFAVWAAAPTLGDVAVVPAWAWIFVGLVLVQTWKSLGLGATFAIVKQSVPADRLAMGFASTEVLRRTGFLVGPLIAAGLLAVAASFVAGFQVALVVAVVASLVATAVQYRYYDASGDSVGSAFPGLAAVREDLHSLPDALVPLLVADTLVRFANGMVYAFFVLVVTDYHAVSLSVGGLSLRPDAVFGLLLAVEMVVAIATKLPVSKLAERTGLKPVVGLGFLVYAVFPVVLVLAPATPWALFAVFAFSGLRFAGLPAHKALIVGPADAETGGRVTGTYYLVRNGVVIPSGVLGGWLYGSAWTVDVGVAWIPRLGPARRLPDAVRVTAGPELAFAVATLVGLVGVAVFARYGREFEPYS